MLVVSTITGVAAVQISLLAFPAMTPLDLVGPLQVFTRWQGAEVETVWKTRDPLESDPGATMVPSADFASCFTAPDIVLVPGGVAMATLMGDEEVLAWLREKSAGARFVTSVCTGALLLGAAGLLRGYRATTHWSAMDRLPDFGAEPVAARWVIDRDRASGGGVTAGIDFALALVAELAGEEEAKTIALMLEYAPAPPFDAGSPEAAGPAIVARVRERYAARASDADRGVVAPQEQQEQHEQQAQGADA